jgi:CubicO group peptidase (beta-lactamase class C family)
MEMAAHRLVELVVGTGVVAYCAYAIYAGRVFGRTRWHSRSEEPWAYWSIVLIGLASGVAFLLGFVCGANRSNGSANVSKLYIPAAGSTDPSSNDRYASAASSAGGAIVENASHMSLDDFGKKNLFAPLAIQNFKWEHVPVNRTSGQGNFSITTRDEAAIGQMVLNGGLVDGHRIVKREWIDASLSRQVAISEDDPFADYYGFMWYTKDEPLGTGKIEVHFASGNGGNKIYMIPTLHMVVAITSSAYGHGYGQRRSQQILLRILAAAR